MKDNQTKKTKPLVSAKENFKKMDKLLFFYVLVMCFIGVVMIQSASSVSTTLRYNYAVYHFFIRQLLIIVVVVITCMFTVVHIETRKYAIFRMPAFIGTIAVLVGLFVFGSITNNARSWFEIGPLNLQPSEFAKSAIIILSAIYYNIVSAIPRQKFGLYLIIIGYGLLCAFLVALQPDLGSAVIIGGITVLMFLASPYSKKNIKKIAITSLIMGLIGIIAILCLKENFLTPGQIKRLTFQEPCTRITDSTGYQVCNGFIAINNGGMYGLGMGNSTQKYLYLPESHTDFIFPIIVEEGGYIAGILVLILYFLILARIIKIAKEAKNLRCSMLAYGTFLFISLHLIINLSGVLAIAPLTGVPLPFLSYGGSSIINFLLMIFITLRVSIENKN